MTLPLSNIAIPKNMNLSAKGDLRIDENTKYAGFVTVAIDVKLDNKTFTVRRFFAENALGPDKSIDALKRSQVVIQGMTDMVEKMVNIAIAYNLGRAKKTGDSIKEIALERDQHTITRKVGQATDDRDLDKRVPVKYDEYAKAKDGEQSRKTFDQKKFEALEYLNRTYHGGQKGKNISFQESNPANPPARNVSFQERDDIPVPSEEESDGEDLSLKPSAADSKAEAPPPPAAPAAAKNPQEEKKEVKEEKKDDSSPRSSSEEKEEKKEPVAETPVAAAAAKEEKKDEPPKSPAANDKDEKKDPVAQTNPPQAVAAKEEKKEEQPPAAAVAPAKQAPQPAVAEKKDEPAKKREAGSQTESGDSASDSDAGSDTKKSSTTGRTTFPEASRASEEDVASLKGPISSSTKDEASKSATELPVSPAIKKAEEEAAEARHLELERLKKQREDAEAKLEALRQRPQPAALETTSAFEAKDKFIKAMKPVVEHAKVLQDLVNDVDKPESITPANNNKYIETRAKLMSAIADAEELLKDVEPGLERTRDQDFLDDYKKRFAPSSLRDFARKQAEEIAAIERSKRKPQTVSESPFKTAMDQYNKCYEHAAQFVGKEDKITERDRALYTTNREAALAAFAQAEKSEKIDEQKLEAIATFKKMIEPKTLDDFIKKVKESVPVGIRRSPSELAAILEESKKQREAEKAAAQLPPEGDITFVDEVATELPVQVDGIPPEPEGTPIGKEYKKFEAAARDLIKLREWYLKETGDLLKASDYEKLKTDFNKSVREIKDSYAQLQDLGRKLDANDLSRDHQIIKSRVISGTLTKTLKITFTNRIAYEAHLQPFSDALNEIREVNNYLSRKAS